MGAALRPLLCKRFSRPFGTMSMHGWINLGLLIRICESMQRKRSLGCAHHVRPMYAGANMGHPSVASDVVMAETSAGFTSEFALAWLNRHDSLNQSRLWGVKHLYPPREAGSIAIDWPLLRSACLPGSAGGRVFRP